jgi:Flp pilus assembly protein CpaB
VLLSVGDPREPASGRTMVLAQNLLVLSVGIGTIRQWDDDRDRPREDPTAQVSLEVALEEAQRLVVARNRGQLRLLLRNPNDVSQVSPPPEVHEQHLAMADRRADWMRRFALVQRPEPVPEPAPAP